jgi:16S rRNA (cytidine1402-2'-O)-methyltransferase
MFLLVPSPLSQKTPKLSVLAADLPLVQGCTTWVVENAKPARAALGLFEMKTPIRDLNIFEINALDESSRKNLIQQAKKGEFIGVMSDAGCPGVADPGSNLILQAHQANCQIHPLVGPSSILLALMGSGLNGQQFTFHGYPPIEPHKREAWIKLTEKESKLRGFTQIAIETPFRNEKLFESFMKALEPDTLLGLAWDLTGEDEHIFTKSVGEWKKNPPTLEKFPCIFMWLRK